MQTFFIALFAVAALLLAAVPGFLMTKTKMLAESCIPGFSKVLLYVCSPCLLIYSFKTAGEFSVGRLASLGIFSALCLGVQALMLGIAYLVLRKKNKEPIYRVLTLATTFANCGFFGIPILEALLPDMVSEIIVYSAAYMFIMNVLGWSVGSAIIARDPKYISPRKIFLNPTAIGTAIGLVVFVTGMPIQGDLFSMITLIGRMSSPLSMIILGMRLATMDPRTLFSDRRIYLTVTVKQFVMPLLAFAVVYFLPVDTGIKQSLFVMAACPVASVVLNYAELIGEGQREGANLVLLGTMTSIITLPLTMILLPALT